MTVLNNSFFVFKPLAYKKLLRYFFPLFLVLTSIVEVSANEVRDKQFKHESIDFETLKNGKMVFIGVHFSWGMRDIDIDDSAFNRVPGYTYIAFESIDKVRSDLSWVSPEDLYSELGYDVELSTEGYRALYSSIKLNGNISQQWMEKIARATKAKFVARAMVVDEGTKSSRYKVGVTFEIYEISSGELMWSRYETLDDFDEYSCKKVFKKFGYALPYRK